MKTLSAFPLYITEAECDSCGAWFSYLEPFLRDTYDFDPEEGGWADCARCDQRVHPRLADSFLRYGTGS